MLITYNIHVHMYKVSEAQSQYIIKTGHSTAQLFAQLSLKVYTRPSVAVCSLAISPRLMLCILMTAVS